MPLETANSSETSLTTNMSTRVISSITASVFSTWKTQISYKLSKGPCGYLIKHHAVKTCGEVDVSFLTSVWTGRVVSFKSWPLPGKEPQKFHWIGTCVGLAVFLDSTKYWHVHLKFYIVHSWGICTGKL
jgi:hypothetical protein